MKILEDGEREQNKNKAEKTENRIAKITGSVEMEQALDRMVKAVNDGFSGGRVTRHDLVSWTVLYFEQECFQTCIEQLRQDHFDQVAHLESVLRLAKEARRSGADAASIAAILSGGSTATPRDVRRRSRKTEGNEVAAS